MSSLGNFVWNIADQLRGVYKPHQYGNVILPMTILRRLDCILEPTRADVAKMARAGEKVEVLAYKIRQRHKINFFNLSPWDMQKLKAEPDDLRANLTDYMNNFSANIDVFSRFKFDAEIATMDEKGRLYLVVSQFADIDLHPSVMSNAAMGDLFEELIRKFAEASNETAGEHFTPRDAIRLMVDLLFAEDSEGLHEPGIVRTVYDPTAGTGGMLSVAEEHLLGQNPNARLTLFGQEINDQSYAICKSDMIAKGQDATNIKLGDTLANDLFAGKTFDYCLSNPPYGVDWKASADVIAKERLATGKAGRFGAGVPSIRDGQMLFLSHLVSKLRPVKDGGGRAGIVLNGSPLFNGGAESGESEIRRSLLEGDLVDAIIALPTNMFYNTGIATYVWILDNTKAAERVGKVQLIDATGFFTKMRKNLGNKSREIADGDRDSIVKLYDSFEDREHSKIFRNGDFGYWTITVERPLRLNFACTPERIDLALAANPVAKVDPVTLRAALELLHQGSPPEHAVPRPEPVEGQWSSREAFLPQLRRALKAADLPLAAPAFKALWLGLSERDENADICRDAKGQPEPDTSLRDTENVPFGEPGKDARDETIGEYFDREVLPHVPDAWIDNTKTRVGYEIPFTRHFYEYVPPRPLEEIDRDLNTLVGEIMTLLREIEK